MEPKVRKSAKFLILLLFALFISSAHATTISNPEELKGIDRYEYWISVSRVPMPDLEMKILEKFDDPNKPTPFRAWPNRKKISLGDWNYLWTPEYEGKFYKRDRVLFRTYFYHEVGHIWDLTKGQGISRKYRKKFLKIMGNKVNRWNCSLKGCEYFADAYARCAQWPKRLPPYNIVIYNYHPTLSQHKKICRLIKRA